MADISKAVEIVFGAVDETATGIDGVVKKLDGLNTKVQSTTQPLADMFDTVFKIQTGFIALGAAAGTWAVTTAADVSDAFREISTLVSEPLEKLEGFRSEVLKTAATSSSTFADFEGAIYSAISAGIDYTDSVEFTTSAEKLAIAGKAGLQESLVVLVSALNAYGKGAEDADYFSDLLFTTVKQGQTTLPELASSLAQVTAIAANAGVDMENLLAAVASLTSVGFGTAEAITGLKAVITSILKPTTDQTAAAEKLGLEFNLVALQSKGLAGFMESVAVATGGSEKALIDLFPNVRSMGPALALTGLAAETFAVNLKAMEDSAGATDIAYGKMVDSFALGNQRVINSFKGMLIEVGDPLLDEMTKIQQAFVDIFLAITKSFESGTLKPVGEAFEGIAKSIATFLTQFAENLPAALKLVDFTPALDAIDLFTGAVKGLFKDFDFSTPDSVAKAIELVIQAFVKFQEIAAAQVAGILPLLNKIKLLAGVFLEMDSETTKTVGSILAFGKEVNILTGYLSPLFDILGGVSSILSSIVLLKVAAKFGLIPAAVTGAATAFSGFLATIAGPVGLIALPLAAGAAVGTMINAILEYNDISIGSSLFDLKEAVVGLLSPSDELRDKFGALAVPINIVTGVTAKLIATFGDFEKAQSAAAIEAARLADAETKAILIGGEYAEAIAKANKQLEAFDINMRKAADGTTITVKEFDALAFASAKLGKSVTDIGVAMKLYAEEQAKVTAEQQKAVDLAEAQIAADNTRLTYIAETNALLEEQGADYRILAGENSNYQRVSLDTFSRVGGSITEVIRALDGVNLSEQQVIQANQLYGESWELVDGLVQRIIPGIGSSVAAADKVTGGWIKTVGVDGVAAFVQVGLKAPKEIKKTEDALNEAEKAAIQFQIAMEDIASNERIKFFEAKFTLDIAEVEANMEIVTALLDSVGTIFESTMSGINQIFAMTKNPEWDRFGLEAKRQLDLYNKILREQVDIQKDIAEAQIAYMNARTQAISKGSALVEIDGAGLQPHLEAFMWEILRAIQVRVNEDGLEMLLGAPA